MYDLRLVIGLVVALALFGFGLFAGYRFEAGKVAELQSEIQTYRNAAKTAGDKLKASQREIDAKLGQKDIEYTQKVNALRQDAETKQKEAQAAIAGKDTQIAAMKTQMGPLKAKLKELREQLKNAPASDKAALQAQVDRDVQDRTALKQQMRGERCSDSPVPKEVIDALNGGKS